VSVEGFVRSAGAAMGFARDAFGVGGPALAPPSQAGAVPMGNGAGHGRAADGFGQESGVVGAHVTALDEHDQAGDRQMRDALAASGIGRERMDSVIAAAVADVTAMGASTSTPQGQRALVAAIKRHLEDTKSTLDGADGDASTRAAGAHVTAAGYDGLGAPPAGATNPAAAMSALSTMAGSAMPAIGGLASPLGGLGSPLAGLGSQLSGLTSLMSPGLGGAGAVAPTALTGVGGHDLGAGDLTHDTASEKGLQKDTILAARAVSEAFPEIKDIGGCRPDSLPWHPQGKAIDVMIPDPTSPGGRALGDAVMRFAMQHKDRFDINHVIWRQTMYLPDGSVQHMENRGSPTQNHMDHVHIATNGGGYPHGGESYRW
jgi:hypothetical protein